MCTCKHLLMCRLSLWKVFVVDGERLREDPVEVMTQVQSFLRLKPVIDFSEKIRSAILHLQSEVITHSSTRYMCFVSTGLTKRKVSSVKSRARVGPSVLVRAKVGRILQWKAEHLNTFSNITTTRTVRWRTCCSSPVSHSCLSGSTPPSTVTGDEALPHQHSRGHFYRSSLHLTHFSILLRLFIFSVQCNYGISLLIQSCT